jgi:prepilin-type N-terminal cleavage/methylation domain-containing protein
MKPMISSRRPLSSGFTLIELLVVIAIIAILAAILFPVFAQAKRAAKGAATISNIKQNQLAAVMYAGDSDDTCVLSWQNGAWLYGDIVGGGGGYAVQWLYPYTKSIDTVWDAVGGIPTIAGGRNIGPGYWGDWETEQTLSWNNNGLMYGSDPSTGLPIPRTYTAVERPSELMQLISVINPVSNTNGGGFAFDGTQGSCYCPQGDPTQYDSSDPGSTGIGLSANKWHAGGYASGFMDGHAAARHGMQYVNPTNDCNNQTYQWWAGESSQGQYAPNNAWSAFYLSDPIIHYWGSWWDASK